MPRKFGIVGLCLLVTAVLLSLVIYLPRTGATDMYSLKIEVEGEGTTDPPPGTYSYEKGQEVTITAKPADGYVFYQWVVDGNKMPPHGKPVLKIRMTCNKLVKAIFIPSEGRDGHVGPSNRFTLRIQVVGEGTTDPAPGEYKYSRGSVVLVRAEPADGYVFYQWEVDGKRVGRGSPLIEIEMNEDHILRALFVERSLTAPLKSIGPEGDASVGTGGTAWIAERRFPEEYSVVAKEIDLSFNEDLLEYFGQGNMSLFLGGPVAIPFAWEEYGVYFSGCSLIVEGLDRRLNATFGVRDYAAILLEANGTVRIAGITRYGTRAGLLWLLQEYDLTAGRSLIVVEWIDLDGDGSVEYWETSPILER